MMAGSRTSRFAWLAAGTVFAVASLGWGTYNAVALLAWDREEFQTTFRVEAVGDVTAIDVDNDAGSVHIVGSDRDDIVVDGDILQGFQKPTHREEIVGDRLVLDASCSAVANFCNVDYEVQIPRDLDVKVHASGGGVRISNIDGNLDASTSGGGVRIEGGRGDMRLRASGGGVRGIGLESPTVDADSSGGGGVRLDFVEEPRTVVASSSGGGVTVIIPDTRVFYAVDAEASGGGVSDDIRSDPDSDRSITVRSSGGGVTVAYPNTE